MSSEIERAIERMSKDTIAYLKDLSTVYKKTGDLKYLREMLEIVRNHGGNASESEVKSYFR